MVAVLMVTVVLSLKPKPVLMKMCCELLRVCGVLHRWGRAMRQLFELSGFDSKAQTAASEEAMSRKAVTL
jgi:spore maturation protein SpmB